MDPKDGKPGSGASATTSDAPTMNALTKRQAIAIPRELASMPDDANAFPSSLPPVETRAFRESSPALAKRRRWSLLFVALAALVTLGTAGMMLGGVGQRPAPAAATLRVEALANPAPAAVAPVSRAPQAAAAPTVAVQPGEPGERSEAVPTEPVPSEAAPGEAVPREALPSEALPSEGVPSEALPSGTARVQPSAATQLGAAEQPSAADLPSEPAPGAASEEGALALLPRAELLLRTDRRPAAAQEARGLLEQVVAAHPINPHAQAALAEACLRLRDAPCAQKAIARAIKLRPRREPYRELERKIQAAFD